MVTEAEPPAVLLTVTLCGFDGHVNWPACFDPPSAAFLAGLSSNHGMTTANAGVHTSRRRARPKLLGETVILFGLTAGVVLAVYLVYGRSTTESPWRVAGTNVQNVSRSTGIQTEVSVAADPSRAGVLFGASNESLEPRIRVFSSTDGGRTWSSSSGPAFDPNTCAWGDPSVAIGPGGRQYVAFIEKENCTRGASLTPYLVVASRAAPGRNWTVRRVSSPAIAFGFDDKPAITVGRDGRAYVAWSRLLKSAYQTTVVSSSSDAGRTWSSPRIVDPSLVQPQLVSVAAGARGVLYVAGVDARGLWIGRSTDGGRRFTVRPAGLLPGSQAATCITAGDLVVPQQARRCLGANPTLSLGRGRVYLTYGANGPDETQDVAVAVFDPSLRLLWRGPVGPTEGKADQFWPASTVDATTGRLWACFYDTTGDSERKQAWFSCTSSRDGRRWTEPVRPTKQPVKPGVLWNAALIYGFGDRTGFGGYVGVAASGDVAYPLWIDTRQTGNQEEVFGARITAEGARQGQG
jgi:hypothetical protein